MTKRIAAVLLLITCCGGVGCATVGSGLRSQQPPVETDTYGLKVQGGLMGDRTVNQPLREGMTVQEVLEAAGLVSRNRDYEIDILRKTNSGSGMVKMPIDYDPGKHRVKFETDYAIHPGDQVVIRPKSYSPMESVSKMLGGQN